MAGWQLRLWRRGLLWSRDRAAEELGVSLRTYKDYENAERRTRKAGDSAGHGDAHAEQHAAGTAV